MHGHLPQDAGGGLVGALLVLAAGVLWGTTGTAQALAPGPVDPRAVGAVRLAVGGLGLFLLSRLTRQEIPAGTWPWPAALLAAAGVAAYQPLFFAAVQRTGVAAGTLVAIGSAPIVAGLLAFLVRGERPGARWAAATAMAVAGCALLASAGGRLDAQASGVLLAIGAGSAYATYTVAGKQLLDRHPPDRVSAVVFTLAAAFLAPLLPLSDLRWLLHPRGLAVALHLGLVATAAAYALFTRGLARVPVATAATLSLAEPLTAAVLGVALLGERLSPTGWAGVGLLAAGVVLLATAPPPAAPVRRPGPTPPSP